MRESSSARCTPTRKRRFACMPGLSWRGSTSKAARSSKPGHAGTRAARGRVCLGAAAYRRRPRRERRRAGRGGRLAEGCPRRIRTTAASPYNWRGRSTKAGTVPARCNPRARMPRSSRRTSACTRRRSCGTSCWSFSGHPRNSRRRLRRRSSSPRAPRRRNAAPCRLLRWSRLQKLESALHRNRSARVPGFYGWPGPPPSSWPSYSSVRRPGVRAGRHHRGRSP